VRVDPLFADQRMSSTSPSSSPSPTALALGRARQVVETFLSITGFVPGHVTLARAVILSSSAASVYYLTHFLPRDRSLAVWYALGTIACYIVFIFLVLPRRGLRLWIVDRWGEERGYLVFEAALSVLFFHSASAISYVASSSRSHLLASFPKGAIVAIATALFVVGGVTKLWAAMAVSVDIYYWKDMFLGRAISPFVVTGPYKYLHSPMYGVGQLQAYALAIWFRSPTGLLIAALNQCCVFLFYLSVEREFVRRTYRPATIALARGGAA